jgi:hypothetical protein
MPSVVERVTDRRREPAEKKRKKASKSFSVVAQFWTRGMGLETAQF